MIFEQLGGIVWENLDSDLSTQKEDGTFNVYEDIGDKLMAKGVPENDGEHE